MKRYTILKVFLSVVLTSAVLLFLDLDNRISGYKKEFFRIAVYKIASRPILDEAEAGVMDALSGRGYVEGKSCTVKKYCAEGDMPTGNMIAQTIVSGNYDIVVSISTPALQTMANANKEGRVKHVFCAVTDPFISGVGITGSAPGQHPPHLVGIGTFQPVERAFDTAREMYPALKKVGTVWCTSEVCSEACVRLARKKCWELGIELVEMSVESSTQILEAAMSLTMRGVEALWLGGDNVVEAGIDQLINAAEKAKIPLFTNNPYKVYGNVIFGVGAKYYDVGQTAGMMAADILEGRPTIEIRTENVVPNYLALNPDALLNMKVKWDISRVQ
ncbi:MAG: ABC transporter substrate-binding protein [Prolixibacteraceae bacterium]|jgi:ABC-type uncharacterized transport system substrate-binding protein|nr:ABC transporter substrate-binding protein [Prolixibacteraceae bacterium]